MRSSLVHIEGDATINTFQDSEGKNQSRLNIVQSELSLSFTFFHEYGANLSSIGRFDFLARKQGPKAEEEA